MNYQPQLAFDPVPPSESGKKAGHPFAITSLICGILGVLVCCCCIYLLNLLFGVAAIVCAIISAIKSKKMSGLAIAGLILGILALIIFFCLFAFESWISGLSKEDFDDLIGDAIKDIFGEEYYEQYMKDMGFSDPYQ